MAADRRLILCAVDGSEHSHAAARVAHGLADDLRGRLLLVSVVGPVTAPGVSAAPRGQERLAEAERQSAEEQLDAVAAELGIEVQRRIEFGSAAGSILRVADEEGASFIVLGTRGRGRMRAAVLGSVSHEVAARAHCPVVIVPA